VQKLAYFARDVRLTFLVPAATGDSLEVASWLYELTERDLEIRMLVVGEKDRLARALIAMRFIFVDTSTNRPTAVPKTLPSTSERNLVVELGPIGPYLETVKNLPRDWKDSPVAAPPAK
jgi:acyl-CoA thioesterase FadM